MLKLQRVDTSHYTHGCAANIDHNLPLTKKWLKNNLALLLCNLLLSSQL